MGRGPMYSPLSVRSLSIGLSMGPSVVRLMNISETVHEFFLIFCMNIGHDEGTKVTGLNF